MSAPQKTATEWLRYLIAHVELRRTFPLVMTYFGDDRLDSRLKPWSLVSVDIGSSTCTTTQDSGHTRYIGPTDDLRVYIPPAQEPA